MLPVALAVALVALPPNETALRYSVRTKARGCTGVELLAEKLRVEAVELRNAQKPADALPLFNAAVLLHPDDTDIRIGRAKTFAALGRYDEQADEYAWVLARNPCSYEAWQSVAEGWIARGKWAEAKKCFGHAREFVGPGRQRCEMLVEEAHYWIGREVAIGSTVRLSLSELAGCPIERLVAAEEALFDALQLDTDALRDLRNGILTLRGLVRHALGRHAEAASDFDTVLDSLPENADVHFVRSAVAFDMKDFATAADHLAAAERTGHQPESDLRQARCKLLLATADYERAETVSAEWVRMAPADHEAALYRAITLRFVGKDEEADQVTAAAAVLCERTFAEQACHEVYAMWAGYDRLDATERLLTRLIANTPDTSELAAAYCNRGALRRQRGENEGALDDLTACVRLRPLSYAPRTTRARMALELRRYDITLEEARALTRLWPHDPTGHKLLADARSAIDMAAGIAGREPDYRPAGPLVTLPGGYSLGAEWVCAYLSKR